MTRISEILKSKGSEVHKIDCDDTIHKAVKKMVKHGVGSLVVWENDNMCGIVTERDILSKVASEDVPVKNKLVDEIMTKNVVCISPDFSVEECMAIMTEKKMRHLPVMVGQEMVGLISVGDLIKQISKDQETHIRYLTDYITGKYPA